MLNIILEHGAHCSLVTNRYSSPQSRVYSSHINTGDQVQISLSPNPSHLEAVDPVVLGKTRAKQFFKQDHSRQQNMGLLLHGDAAFSGLGLAAEVMQVYFV
jgi:2-oxoglutarate dehydrogenase complex dehydrogenase (E1) component-like enzyme